jgi:hypothetical protein
MRQLRSVKITFGIIVLNGEPFTRYCIRALYSHAHEIIIVEGACEGARSVATIDGHSIDGTLELLKEIKRVEDPENKIIIITAEDYGYPDGFWPGEKNMMSQAYASRATGNYIWQVDIDEFYHDDKIAKIKSLLEEDPTITAVTFRQVQFWGGFRYLVDSWLLRRGAHDFHRLFKWGNGYKYLTHRPPTVLNENGRDLRAIHWVKAEDSLRLGIFLHHYSFVFPKQVYEKAQYYKNADWSKREKADWWSSEVFMKLKDPFSVFSIYWDISWLKRFTGSHPEQINCLISDIDKGNISLKVRETTDIETLLRNPIYNLKIRWFIFLNPLNEIYCRYTKSFRRKLKRIINEGTAL